MLISQAVSLPLQRNYETPDLLMFGETQMKKVKQWKQSPSDIMSRVYTHLQKQISRTFPGLFQDSDCFSKHSQIHINPYTPKILMLILLTVFHTLHIFKLSLTDFQNFPRPVAFFQDFPVLENAIIKFQDFPGFPGPGQTL